MDAFLREEFIIPAKNPSVEVLGSWRKLCGIVKNRKRRFRYTANLSKRRQAEDMRRSNRVKKMKRTTLLNSKGYPKSFVREMYQPPEEVSKTGFEIDADMLSSIVISRNSYYLKEFFGFEGIARCLNASLDTGVSTTDRPSLSVRKEIYGSNTYDDKPHKSFWTFLWDAFHDMKLVFLLVCAVVSGVLGTTIEGCPEGINDALGIMLCILLVVGIVAISDYKLYLQLQDLDEQKKKTFIHVTRDGKKQKCSIYDLVVGDVVHLTTGDIVPADGLFFSHSSLLVDESSLTGESESVNVNEENPFLFKGTKVQDGSGKMLVASVGMRTYWGSLIATMRQSGENKTPLQVKLKVGLTFSLMTFLMLTAGLVFGKALHNEFLEWSITDALKVLNSVTIAATVLVAGVPEGMLLGEKLILAFVARKLMNKRALLKHISSCETLASVTSICTDKTGTLTTNHMVVDRLFVCNEVIMKKDAADFLKSAKCKGVLDILLHSVFLNCDVTQRKDGMKIVSDCPTESALLGFALFLGGHYDDRLHKFKVLRKTPFDSFRKRREVCVACPEVGVRMFCIGAAEVILRECTKIVCNNGESVHFSKDQKEKVQDINNEFCCGALRTLCLAFRDGDDSCDDYTLIAILGISNPVRPKVKSVVQEYLAAGISVRMVTGDNINTAKAIARECGILSDDGLAIEASDLHSIGLKKLKEIIPKIQVVARCSPDDKSNLVTQLSKLGEVVAVTGDGTNDAPALRVAHVGLAMGIAGTEVAREGADVVLMDDDFTNLLNLVKWGCFGYIHIQQLVQFQLTIHVVAVVFNFVSVCISGSTPLTALQLLWVKMISDILCVLVLVTKLQRDQLEDRASVGRNKKGFTIPAWSNISGQTIYQLVILFILTFCGKRLLKLSDEDAGRVLHTVIFNTFVLFQVFNEINYQEVEKINVLRGMLNSWHSVTVIAAIVIVQVVAVEFLGPFAHIKPLGWRLWFVSIVIGFASMRIFVLLKCITSFKLRATIFRWIFSRGRACRMKKVN
ncbi:calcium-transporting ATPase 4, plasma membrane-type-like [Actinidia eriantha]|uniref:calcium-transporting ATPase 4, plasma membrane-type-like n=1 Tax=Actinidia eriantha TaxID=165200 RepID=UPI0025852A48|nr:calcium-transporting ATPase 4, plasma membrane-type-like [Actinidia eriantha]